jgi:hypothetical protein
MSADSRQSHRGLCRGLYRCLYRVCIGSLSGSASGLSSQFHRSCISGSVLGSVAKTVSGSVSVLKSGRCQSASASSHITKIKPSVADALAVAAGFLLGATGLHLQFSSTCSTPRPATSTPSPCVYRSCSYSYRCRYITPPPIAVAAGFLLGAAVL